MTFSDAVFLGALRVNIISQLFIKTHLFAFPIISFFYLKATGNKWSQAFTEQNFVIVSTFSPSVNKQQANSENSCPPPFKHPPKVPTMCHSVIMSAQYIIK